jgi:putative membrane protein
MRQLGAVLLAAMAACTSQGSEAAEWQADTSGKRDSVAGVAAASMNEAQVVGLLALVHDAGSRLGELGGARGSTREIKDFGLMMMREHQALARDARGLGDGLRLAVTPPAVPPDEAPESFRANLDATPAGAGWDRAYVEYAIASHYSAMENTARALAATQSPATRDYIRKSVPILEKHVEKARSLQKALARTQPETARP